jgi:hypothetical protein
VLDEDMEDVAINTASGDDEIDLLNNNLSPPVVSSPFGPLSSSSRMITTPSGPPDDNGDTVDSSFDLADIQYAYEALEILSGYYGFVPLLPFPSASSMQKKWRWQRNTGSYSYVCWG